MNIKQRLSMGAYFFACFFVTMIAVGVGPAIAQSGSDLRLVEPQVFVPIGQLTQMEDDSLGDMIRRRGRELGEDEPTERLQDLRRESQADDENAEADATESDRSIESQLRRLRKPMNEIDIQASDSSLATPKNRANEFAADEPPIFIGALGATIPGPDRYTICQMHQPLYFEQRNLERCGQGYGVFQNAISAAVFFKNTIVLPYKMGSERPACLVPSGGDCRTCQSYGIDLDLFPIDALGVVSESAAIAGFLLLVL